MDISPSSSDFSGQTPQNPSGENPLSGAKKDTHSYKGWLNSDSFWKRAFGIVFYGLAAQLVFMVFWMIIMMIFGLGFMFMR